MGSALTAQGTCSALGHSSTGLHQAEMRKARATKGEGDLLSPGDLGLVRPGDLCDSFGNLCDLLVLMISVTSKYECFPLEKRAYCFMQ